MSTHQFNRLHMPRRQKRQESRTKALASQNTEVSSTHPHESSLSQSCPPALLRPPSQQFDEETLPYRCHLPPLTKTRTEPSFCSLTLTSLISNEMDRHCSLLVKIRMQVKRIQELLPADNAHGNNKKVLTPPF